MKADIVFLFVILHRAFDGLSAIVQSAEHRVFGHALYFGDLTHRKVIKILHHNRAALGIGQTINKGSNGIFEILVLHSLIGDIILILLFEGIKNAGHIVPLVRYGFVSDVLFLIIPCALMISYGLHPRNEGGLLPQLADGLYYFNKAFLYNIASDIGILHLAQCKIIYIVLIFLKKRIKGLGFTLLCL